MSLESNLEGCVLDRIVANRKQNAAPSIYPGLKSEIEEQDDVQFLECNVSGCEVSCLVKDRGDSIAPVETIGKCVAFAARLSST
jgi:hypothetical protein